MNVNIKRIENKYFIPKSEKTKLLNIINKELHFTKNKYDKNHTDVETIYLDSEDLFCYKAHFKIGEPRFKVRIRTYSPDGVRENLSYVELKSKYEGISEKHRFSYPNLDPTNVPLKYDDKIALKHSDAEQEEHVDESKEHIKKSVEMINNVINFHEMTPIAMVSYKRKAFEGNGLRITIDSNLKTKLLKEIPKDTLKELQTSPSWIYAEYMKNYLEDNDFLIVEVKNEDIKNNKIPKSLKAFLKDHKVHFSKYIYSVTSGIMDSV